MLATVEEVGDLIVVMQSHATQQEIDNVVSHVYALGYRPHISEGEETTIIGIIGHSAPEQLASLEFLPGVDHMVQVTKPFKLGSRDFRPKDTVVQVDGVRVGGEELVIIAGPCSVESESQLWETAEAVKAAGGRVLRGGAFKPRSSPYSFQGLGQPALKMLDEVRRTLGLRVVTEVLAPEDVELVTSHVDILQVGARNMQNFALLQEVGRSGHPVLLKRGMSATIEELLMSAEYVLANGNDRVILCERGIRTFENSTRFTLDITAVPVLKHLSHLPVIVDPSHATGKWIYVPSAARAGIAAGADGLIVEIHPRPQEALSDGAQSLRLDRFGELMRALKPLATAVGRSL
ncbi:MAG TPA: 3-deoxy-7-phosphoheptulonate synthase [Chloroflexota bacterium]|nr:3-deoxy-7-phosphoheptulonate synthase [Chloroflexota bacterium]